MYIWVEEATPVCADSAQSLSTQTTSVSFRLWLSCEQTSAFRHHYIALSWNYFAPSPLYYIMLDGISKNVSMNVKTDAKKCWKHGMLTTAGWKLESEACDKKCFVPRWMKEKKSVAEGKVTLTAMTTTTLEVFLKYKSTCLVKYTRFFTGVARPRWHINVFKIKLTRHICVGRFKFAMANLRA